MVLPLIQRRNTDQRDDKTLEEKTELLKVGSKNYTSNRKWIKRIC